MRSLLKHIIVFGEYAGTRILPILIALSAFGNLLSVAIGQARIIREVARQGVSAVINLPPSLNLSLGLLGSSIF